LAPWAAAQLAHPSVPGHMIKTYPLFYEDPVLHSQPCDWLSIWDTIYSRI